MQTELLIDIGIPMLVIIISYLAVRWSGVAESKSSGLIGSEPLIHQSYDRS